MGASPAVDARPEPVAFQGDAKVLEHPLSVVPAQVRFGDGGGALGKQAGQQDRAFHLSARHWRNVVDAVQRATVDAQRRAPFGTLRGDARAHLAERFDHTPHRPV